MSKQKQKGTAYETLVVRFLRASGFPHAERRALHGGNDEGDVTGVPGVVWECKNHKALKLSEWLNETEVERDNANADVGVLVVKRQGFGTPEKHYAVLTLQDVCRLLVEAGYGVDG